jgi:hypothetical protein
MCRRKHEAWVRKHRPAAEASPNQPQAGGPLRTRRPEEKKADHFTHQFPARVQAGHRLRIYSDNAQVGAFFEMRFIPFISFNSFHSLFGRGIRRVGVGGGVLVGDWCGYLFESGAGMESLW